MTTAVLIAAPKVEVLDDESRDYLYAIEDYYGDRVAWAEGCLEVIDMLLAGQDRWEEYRARMGDAALYIEVPVGLDLEAVEGLREVRQPVAALVEDRRGTWEPDWACAARMEEPSARG
ncbi:MAG TPA: hypothetical protein VFN74_25610 [Chloroflexota bacterium]|nr:hypothetical protein [Chloroflexota bacterium]